MSLDFAPWSHLPREIRMAAAGRYKLPFLGGCHSDPSVSKLHHSRHFGTLCHSLSLRYTKYSKGVCSSPLQWPSHLLVAFLLSHGCASLCAGLPFPAISAPSQSHGLRGSTLEHACLTGVGVLHDRGQVPPLVYVHRHEGRVLADYVAGLAGVHSVHLVPAIGPCGRKSEVHCLGSESIAWRL